MTLLHPTLRRLRYANEEETDTAFTTVIFGTVAP